MTEQEIYKYFKQKHLFPYFKALANIETYFKIELDANVVDSFKFNKHHKTIEETIQTQEDLDRIETKINSMFGEGRISTNTLKVWYLSLYYKNISSPRIAKI